MRIIIRWRTERPSAQTAAVILSEAKDLPPPPSAQSHGRAAGSAPTAAVGPAGRLPCGARSAVAPHNSLRSLRSLRSNRRGESEVEARACSARRPQPCAPRRRRVAAPAARPRLCESTDPLSLNALRRTILSKKWRRCAHNRSWAHVLHHVRRRPSGASNPMQEDHVRRCNAARHVATAFANTAALLYERDLKQMPPKRPRHVVPFVVNASFAVELFLKALSHRHGVFLRGHQLPKRYDRLPEDAALDQSASARVAEAGPISTDRQR